ncbi:unnamed protein product (mitochondrion) [Plasmodiophora brassicae]|uniref:3-hydroxyisobutyryl-CoA hydrolase n=1 Tax=Plasmodiophora brassicae TaxID=37360 RepID=A0A3P3Y4L3_PLABS|nr:unnamed protein product [Plasmodiophora brassicae]
MRYGVLRRPRFAFYRMMSSSETKIPVLPLPDPKSDEEITFVRNGGGLFVTLNRPKALNSLTTDMIDRLYANLKKAEDLAGVYHVVVRGAGGKAYCAGGDVKALTLAKQKDGNTQMGQTFFRREYRMNHLIATMQKNYVAVMDGITMGGGVGISLPGRFRIATENTVWAMPETAIGLFPDVGASYFLPRLKGQLGVYLALTGASLKGADVFHAGIATHFVPSHLIPTILDRIQELQPDPGSVNYAIRERHYPEPPSQGFLAMQPVIDQCFSKSSVEAIIDELKSTGTQFGQAVVDKLEQMCPLSLKVAFKAIRAGKHLSLEQCFQMEYRLARHFLDSPDFYEGVRAALIDKDKRPKWQHARVSDVPESLVTSFFGQVDNELLLQPPVPRL